MSENNSKDELQDNEDDAVEEEIISVESIESDKSNLSVPKLDTSSIGLLLPIPILSEICTKHIPDINNDLKKHPYYFYPPVNDPGIIKTLHDPEIDQIFEADGQQKYIYMCQVMNHLTVKRFYKNLLQEKIDLKYYSISSNWMRAMCEALMKNKTIQTIDLTDNELTTDACFHLGDLMVQSKYITCINLHGCRIGPEGARRLLDGIQVAIKLEELNLSYNDLGDEGIEILAPAMTESRIKRYNFSHNNLKTVAGQELSKALLENETVTHIDVSWNFMENRGVVPLLRSLNKKPIQYLNISWNGLNETKIETPLVVIIKSPTIKHLDVSNNMIKGEVLMKLAYLLFRAKNLEILRIGNNQLTPKDALNILSSYQNKRVTCNVLDLGETNVTPAFAEAVEELKLIPTRRKATVRYGNILGNYVIIGPDPREIGFKRAKYVAETKKKKDFGEFILRLSTIVRKKKPSQDEFIQFAKADGIVLDNELFSYICAPFANKKKKIDVMAMADYTKEIWPNTRLVLHTQEQSVIPAQDNKSKKIKK